MNSDLEPSPPPRSIRAATSMILMRRTARGAEVLMGKRGAQAAFMASKHVFPGGAVDPEDQGAPIQGDVSRDCLRRLTQRIPQDAPPPAALVAAGLRELTEETGLRIAPPASLAPEAPALRFVFRAITPPGRSRRFDARFLLADGAAVEGDATGFAQASGELSDLGWIDLARTGTLDLPFVTQIILAELRAMLNGAPDHGVPFLDNATDLPAFHRLV